MMKSDIRKIKRAIKKGKLTQRELEILSYLIQNSFPVVLSLFLLNVICSEKFMKTLLNSNN